MRLLLPPTSLHFAHFQPLGIFCNLQLFNQLIQIAVDHCPQVVQREVNPVVGNPTLRVVVGADFVLAIAGGDHGLPFRRNVV